MSEQEKRRFVRIHFKRQVQLDFFTEFYDKCQITNLSFGGLFVSGKFPHKIDDQCYLNLAQTSKTTSLTLKALAKVIRRDDKGIALEFVSMSFESLLSLEMVILYQEREKSADSDIQLPENIPFKICEDAS
jgi:hypothetical protein